MRIFDNDNGGWACKVNFVDANNVFVGYDTSQCCCENADWFIQDSLADNSVDLYDTPDTPSNEDLEGYAFDKEFHEDVDHGGLDSGGMVVFKLVKDGSPDLFLHLFNVHNGYYGHGFEFGIKDGEIFESGCL